MIVTPRANAAPLRVALVNDYEIVLRGLAQMFRPYRDRICVVELDARMPVASPVDIARLTGDAAHPCGWRHHAGH